jgi:L-fucose dehydrogenase
MDLGIKDKVMIVTGGAKGIGEGISRCIAEEGGIPVIAGRSRNVGELLENELKAQGHDALFLEMELSAAENCEKVVELTMEKFGRMISGE